MSGTGIHLEYPQHSLFCIHILHCETKRESKGSLLTLKLKLKRNETVLVQPN